MQAGGAQRFCITCGANLQPTSSSGRGTAAEPAFSYPVPSVAWPSAQATPSAPVTPLAEVAPAVQEAGPRHARPARDPGRPLRVATLACAGLLVVGGGYLVGDRLLLADDDPAAAQAVPGTVDAAAAVDPSSTAGSSTATATAAPPVAGPLLPVSVTASCSAPPAVDAAGAPVTFDPANTLDGVGGTAWRCAGSAVGQRLVFDFGRPVVVSSVALVPGYAKTDPVDGTDRFGENRTVTAVAWGFDTGAVHRQDVAAPSRDLAEAPLDQPVTTTRVVLEIAGTGNDGAIRDFTTISDVAFAGSG
ncbi:hypothetical protein DQ239_04120 [Blastococcus sp. TF02-09]|nr:hypothetical protein DQ239_04120 [Blastococcus sp. TF02-9]